MSLTLRSLWRAGPAIVAATIAAGACRNPNDALLQANDPDVINPIDVQSSDGAEAVRIGALGRLTTLTALAPANTEGVWFMGGLLTDEWKSGDTFVQRDETDKRTVALDNAIVTAGFQYIHRARISANQAIDLLKKYRPNPAANIGGMYFVRAYAEMLAGETFCNGQPFSDGSSGDIVEGPPVSIAEAFQMAIKSAEDGLAATGTGTDANSVKVQNALTVVRARALIDLGGATNYATAAASLAAVPTNFSWDVTFLQASGSNGIWSLNNSAKRYVVGDSFDITGRIQNALPFVSANDPRVPTSGTGRAFDTTTPFKQQLIWASLGSPAGREDPVAVVNGIDARLMEAEVLLSQDNVAGWLAKLNALRTGPTQLSAGRSIAGMTPLVDPGTPAARLSLQFREKAFWTFGRGERLGDLRRLIRQYQRPQDQVFPVGTFHKGGTYGSDVNLPVPQAEQNNSQFRQCTNRDA